MTDEERRREALFQQSTEGVRQTKAKAEARKRKPKSANRPETPPPIEERPPEVGPNGADPGKVSLTLLALVGAITSHPDLARAYRENLLTGDVETDRELPALARAVWRQFTDQDNLEATAFWQANGFAKVNKHTVFDAVCLVAHRRAFHPTRDYFNSLQFDGVARDHTLFIKYFNAELPDVEGEERDHLVAYCEQAAICFLVGAVARIMQPGCKNDLVPVVVGPQRWLKSTALRELCHDQAWFSDNISPNVIERDTKESLRGKWIIELAEMPHARHEVERVKIFVSTQQDRYREAYGKLNRDWPRQCAFIGTSNDLEFIDVTGNSRWLPFRIAKPVDVAAIKRDRDQLWAEAVHLYRQGVQWWLPTNLEPIAREQQAGFAETDVWEALIDNWIEQRPKHRNGVFSMGELFEEGTGITPYRPLSAVTKADEMRAGRALKRLHYRRRRFRLDGVRDWWWEPKESSQ